MPRAYTLQGDVLFPFGKSGYGDLKQDGQQAIGKVIDQLWAEHVVFELIEVVGHTDADTDQIGNDAANNQLGMRRAETVRRVLINGGMPVNQVQPHRPGAGDQRLQRWSGTTSRLLRAGSTGRPAYQRTREAMRLSLLIRI